MVRCVAPIFPEIVSQLTPADIARVDKPCHPDSSLPQIPRCGSHSLRGIYSSSQSFCFVLSSAYSTYAVLIARAGSDCLFRPQKVEHNCRQLGCHPWCGRRIGSSRYARFRILFSGVQYGFIFSIYSHSVCSCHGFACPSHRYVLLLPAHYTTVDSNGTSPSGISSIILVLTITSLPFTYIFNNRISDLHRLRIDTGSSKKSACLSLGAEHFLDFQECIAAATISASESGKSEAEKSTIVALAVVNEIVRVCGGVGPHAAVIISPSVRVLILLLQVGGHR